MLPLLKNFLRNAPTADILHGDIVMDLLKSLKGPFTELTFFPKFFFEAFPSAGFPCIVRAAHHLGIAICMRISFDLLHNFFAGRLHFATDVVFLLVFLERRRLISSLPMLFL